MPLNDDTSDLRQTLTHAEAVIAELRGVVAELRKQIESQQAHIDRLVKMTFADPVAMEEGVFLRPAKGYAMVISDSVHCHRCAGSSTLLGRW